MAVSETDRYSLQTIILRVISDPTFRMTFNSDPTRAIDESGLTFSPEAKAALIANASRASGLTANMDNVTAAFFFFYNHG